MKSGEDNLKKQSNNYILIPLLIIILFTVFTRIIIHIFYPNTLIAFDAYEHIKISGHLILNTDMFINDPWYKTYAQFPSLHLITASMSQILDLSLMNIYKYVITSVTTLLLVISTYLFTQNIFKKKEYSLLSAAFVGINDLLIMRIMFDIPESIGLPFFAFLLYALVRFRGYTRYGLSGLILVMLSYTHHLTFFISAATACFFFAYITTTECKEFKNTSIFIAFTLFLVYFRFFGTRAGEWITLRLQLPNPLILIILFLILFIVIFRALLPKSQAILSKFTFQLKMIFGNTKIVTPLTIFIFCAYILFNYYYTPEEFYRETFASLNKILVFELALFGMYFVHNRAKLSENSEKHLFLLLPCILIFVASFYFLKISDLYFLPFRVLSFVFIVISPLAALGTLKLIESIRAKKAILLVFILLIIMSSSFYNSFYFYDEKYDIFPQSQEYSSAEFLNQNVKPSETVLMDNRIGRFVKVDCKMVWYNKDLIEKPNTDYIVWKSRIHQFTNRSSVSVTNTLNKNPYLTKVYNNHNAMVYRNF